MTIAMMSMSSLTAQVRFRQPENVSYEALETDSS